MPTVSETLYRVADHIATFGHFKRNAFEFVDHYETSPACIYGALGAIRTNEDEFNDALSALRSFLDRDPIDFNDDPLTTQAGVVAALRACAVIESARETEAEAAAIIAGALSQPVVVVAK